VRYRAVIFDLGGVVLGSPLEAIAAYERERSLPEGFVNRVVVAAGPEGAWSRLERGELRLEEFYPAFERDCARAGREISGRELMARVAESAVPRPVMLAAIERIRSQGLATAALTNNWITEEPGATALRPHFDVVIESAVVGVRKPDPRIFGLTCEALGIAPADAVFLDDIGSNLKAARSLGMTTIKVLDADAALDELERVLGFALRACA
jgi:epoxide hydrolase-like predicted phosphatase